MGAGRTGGAGAARRSVAVGGGAGVGIRGQHTRHSAWSRCLARLVQSSSACSRLSAPVHDWAPERGTASGSLPASTFRGRTCPASARPRLAQPRLPGHRHLGIVRRPRDVRAHDGELSEGAANLHFSWQETQRRQRTKMTLRRQWTGCSPSPVHIYLGSTSTQITVSCAGGAVERDGPAVEIGLEGTAGIESRTREGPAVLSTLCAFLFAGDAAQRRVGSRLTKPRRPYRPSCSITTRLGHAVQPEPGMQTPSTRRTDPALSLVWAGP